jgi:hypothetical protein
MVRSTKDVVSVKQLHTGQTSNPFSALFMKADRSQSPVYSGREPKRSEKLPSREDHIVAATDLPTLARCKRSAAVTSKPFQGAVYECKIKRLTSL